MDRNNYGTGQIVQESELDGSFDYTEDSERNAAIDEGMCQALNSATFGPATYGGILWGGTVTRVAGADYVQLAAGCAKDQAGRRIEWPACTIKITNVGSSAEGDSADAVGSGGAISGYCTSGQCIVASLFAVFDTHQSDPRFDSAATLYYFKEEESFHFAISVGTPFTSPPGSTPSRAALADNQVLLDDLVLYNNAGSMEVVANGVCASNANWDTLGGNYANLTGRRSDWIAMEDPSVYPALNTLGATFVRGGTPRDAIRGLAWFVHNYALWMAGGNVMQPAANYNGFELYNYMLSYNKSMFEHWVDIVGSSQGVQKKIGKRFGHDSKPHELFDDFMYYGDSGLYQTLPTAGASPWVVATTGTSSMAEMDTEPGGVVKLYAGNTIGDYTSLTSLATWNCGAPPWNIFTVRFKTGAAEDLVDTNIIFGMYPTSGSSRVLLTYSDDTDGGNPNSNLYLSTVNSSGGSSPTSLGALAADTWYTVNVVTGLGTTSMAQVNNGAWVTNNVVSGSVDASGEFQFYALLQTTSNADKVLYIDRIRVSDLLLSIDM